MLYSADAIIDLTTRENCLLCGAYEAVACGTPLILSNTKTLRNYFNSGSVYVDNTVESIQAGVEEMVANQLNMEAVMGALKGVLEADWQQRFQVLKNKTCQ